MINVHIIYFWFGFFVYRAECRLFSFHSGACCLHSLPTSLNLLLWQWYARMSYIVHPHGCNLNGGCCLKRVRGRENKKTRGITGNSSVGQLLLKDKIGGCLFYMSAKRMARLNLNILSHPVGILVFYISVFGTIGGD